MAAAFSLGGSLLEAQDVLEVVLQKVDAPELCQIKAVNVAWCNHVRRELRVRLCHREGQREPAGVDSITDLDVEFLNEAGRLWEVVIASRQLPQLARLHGYSLVVDVQAVREAHLEEEDDEDGPLGGAALRSCIQGEGQPPNELLLAAVACAASGTVQRHPPYDVRRLGRHKRHPTVRGVPVQLLREDNAIDEVDLSNSDIGFTAAKLLGLMLPAATSLRSLNLKRNRIGPKGGAALAEGLKGNSTLQVLRLGHNYLGPDGGAALAEALKGNSTLQVLDLTNNQLCGLDRDGHGKYTTEGITKLCEGLKGSAVTSLNLGGNQLCGLNQCGNGTYTTEGIAKLCDGLKGSGVTSLELGRNNIGAGHYEGIIALCEGLKGSAVTSLNLPSNRLGPDAAAALAEGLKGNLTLQSLKLAGNWLCVVDGNGTWSYTAEGITKLCEALKGTAVTSLDLDRNILCGIHPCHTDEGTYTAEVITKLCEGLKGSAVTSLSLAGNGLCGLNDEGHGTYTSEGITKLCEALKESNVTSLDIGYNRIGDKGASALAAVLKETQITNLNIAFNSIGVEGASALAAILKKTQITTLNFGGHDELRGSRLTSSGAQELQIDKLRGTKPTEGICLSDIGVASAIIIASCVTGNGVLKWLNVDGRALPIDELLGTKPTEEIDLSSKKLGVVSTIIIASCIKGNRVLKKLTLFDNSIGDQGASALAAVLKETQITTLNLRGNAFGDEAKQAIKVAAGSSVRIIWPWCDRLLRQARDNK